MYLLEPIVTQEIEEVNLESNEGSKNKKKNTKADII